MEFAIRKVIYVQHLGRVGCVRHLLYKIDGYDNYRHILTMCRRVHVSICACTHELGPLFHIYVNLCNIIIKFPIFVLITMNSRINNK